MRINYTAVLLLVLLSPSMVQAQGYTWQPMSPEDAVQIVRRFEGNAGLQVVPRPGSTVMYPLNISHVQNYDLLSGDREYSFDMRRRDSLFFTDKRIRDANFYGQPYDSNVLGPQAMSQPEAENIARNYMQAHFPNPEKLNKMEVSKHYGESKPTNASFIQYYTFAFYEDINGVRGPAECTVRVDTIFGRILMFISNNIPVIISTMPRLTPEQAYAILFNTLQVNGVPSGEPKLYVEYPDALGNQLLEYRMDFFVGFTHYFAVVDANSGTLLATFPYHGGGTLPVKPVSAAIKAWRSKLAQRPTIAKTVLKPMMGGMEAKLDFPPLLVNNQPYVYVGYLCYGAKNVKLTYKGRDRIAVASPERSLQFSLNSTAYTCNGQSKQLLAKPVLVDDRCYVPLEAAQGVLPFAIAYNAAAKQVKFDPLPAANKTAANAPTATSPPPAPNTP